MSSFRYIWAIFYVTNSWRPSSCFDCFRHVLDVTATNDDSLSYFLRVTELTRVKRYILRQNVNIISRRISCLHNFCRPSVVRNPRNTNSRMTRYYWNTVARTPPNHSHIRRCLKSSQTTNYFYTLQLAKLISRHAHSR